MRGTPPDMRALIAAFDWTHTPLGARSAWPSSLRLMTDVALRSQFPMLLFWGRDFVQLYNDAFIPIFGARHPRALGRPARESWPELWNEIEPMLTAALDRGESAWGENVPFFTTRNGFLERAFFTYCYSQFGDANEAGGVLCTAIETSAAVFREIEFRQMADAVADMMYTHAPDGAVEWTNARWHEYTRLPPELSLTAEGWSRIIPHDDYTRLHRIQKHAFLIGESYEAEVRIKPFGAADDEYRWHIVRGVPMRGLDRKIVRWAGNATDIHDRRVAEDSRHERLERDFDREHRASMAFQTAALPRALPTIPGITFDAIYEGAERSVMVGGDWYDAFRLSDGRVVVSVGDVVGSGLDAAITMSAMRQAIRGAAQVFPEPAAVLNAADRALRSEQPDRIVTVFLGIIDPLTRSFSYASAGHPPPLLRLKNGATFELDARGLPLGLRNEPSPGESVYVAVPDEAMLVLYTDGLTESTRNVLEGEQKLRAALQRSDVIMSAFPASAIRQAMLKDPTDDIAILTIRFGNVSSSVKRWSCSLHTIDDVMRMRREFSTALDDGGANAVEIADAEVVFGELIANGVRHTDGRIDVALDLTAVQPVLHVLDRGPGFTFHAHLPNDAMSETGRGLYIVTKLAQEVSVVRRQSGGSHARVVLAAKQRRVTDAPVVNVRPVPEPLLESPSVP